MSETNELHTVTPALWMENNNLLYIASTWANCVERLDLRENKWNAIMGDLYSKNSKSFNDLFGHKIKSRVDYNCLAVAT